MKKIFALRAVFVLALALWMVFIFALSSQDATQSSELSRGFVYKLFCVIYPRFEEFSLGAQGEIIASVMFPVRKMAHFTEYAVLGALSYLAVCSYEKLSDRMKNVTALIISFLYSVSDEIHQAFVPGRACRLLDIGIDTLGALLAILAVSFVFVKRRKKNG